MVDIKRTPEFANWLKSLRDQRAIARIGIRIDRMAQGNSGDVKPVGDDVHEMRIDYRPGYRVYYTQHGRELILLLCGGDKGSQARDIRKAKALATKWSGEWQ